MWMSIVDCVLKARHWGCTGPPPHPATPCCSFMICIISALWTFNSILVWMICFVDFLKTWQPTVGGVVLVFILMASLSFDTSGHLHLSCLPWPQVFTSQSSRLVLTLQLTVGPESPLLNLVLFSQTPTHCLVTSPLTYFGSQPVLWKQPNIQFPTKLSLPLAQSMLPTITD